MNTICELKDRLVSCLKASIDMGIENVDTHEAYEVADIIKDLAEAEKLCHEAEYYKTVTKAMEQGGTQYMLNNYEEPNFKMGYTRPHYDANVRMGYPEYGVMGYNEGDRRYYQNDSRYGTAYHNYSTAKRNYTDTKNPNYKDQMDRSVNEYLSDVMTAVREMWRTADPNVRLQIKNDLTNLINEMK